MLEADFCLIGDTDIETINGKQRLVDIINKYMDEDIYVYCYNKEEMRIGISKVIRGGLTGKNREVWKVVLDNSESIIATPEHEFLLRDSNYLPLHKLKVGDSLMPFYKNRVRRHWGVSYERVHLNNGKHIFAHNLIARDLYGIEINKNNMVVHHKDGNGLNNELNNLEIMDRKRHMNIHSIQGWRDNPRTFEWHKSKEGRERISKINRGRYVNLPEWEKDEIRTRIRGGMYRKYGGPRFGIMNPMFGRIQSTLTRLKISKAKLGKRIGWCWNRGLTKFTSKSMMKISIANTGRPNCNKGRKLQPLSSEHKRKISLKLKGRKFSDLHIESLSRNKLKYWENRVCRICGRIKATNNHLKVKHNIQLEEYQEKYNHKIVSIEFYGYEDVYNITVENHHNFAIGAGIIVKNSGQEVRTSACYHKDP